MPHVRVFVYGTLMRTGANHRVLVALGARWISEARTADRRTIVDLGPYPALLPADEARDARAPQVHGEIFVLEESELAELDAFEGCPTLYTRESIAVSTLEGTTRAFTYVLARKPPKTARPLTTGRYEKLGLILERGAHASQLEDE